MKTLLILICSVSLFSFTATASINEIKSSSSHATSVHAMAGFWWSASVSNDLCCVKFNLPANAITGFQILNSSGNAVVNVPYQMYSAGKHHLDIDVMLIPAGKYALVINFHSVGQGNSSYSVIIDIP